MAFPPAILCGCNNAIFYAIFDAWSDPDRVGAFTNSAFIWSADPDDSNFSYSFSVEYASSRLLIDVDPAGNVYLISSDSSFLKLNQSATGFKLPQIINLPLQEKVIPNFAGTENITTITSYANTTLIRTQVFVDHENNAYVVGMRPANTPSSGYTDAQYYLPGYFGDAPWAGGDLPYPYYLQASLEMAESCLNIFKYDSAGNELWRNIDNYYSINDSFNNLGWLGNSDSAGNVYLCGMFSDNLTCPTFLDFCSGNPETDDEELINIFYGERSYPNIQIVLKLNGSNGSVVWDLKAMEMGSLLGFDFFEINQRGILVYPNGDFLLYGRAFNLTDYYTTTSEGVDYFVKLSANKTVIWSMLAENFRTVSPYFAAIDDEGNSYFNYYDYSGSNLVYIQKYDTNGNWVWAKRTTFTSAIHLIFENGFLYLVEDDQAEKYDPVTGDYLGQAAYPPTVDWQSGSWSGDINYHTMRVR